MDYVNKPYFKMEYNSFYSLNVKNMRACIHNLFLSLLLPAGNHQLHGGNWKLRGRKNHRSMPNAHVRSEIKDSEQVRKDRQKKANRISHMKSKPMKGKKKFGKNGKRGKSK